MFEKYSTTKTKGKLSPISVNLSPTLTFDKLKEFYEKKDFVRTVFNREFFEIFLNDYGFEVTISIGHDNDSTASIGISVYNESGRGGTKRRLRAYHEELTEFLKHYIQ